jgi:hypothetical protein
MTVEDNIEDALEEPVIEEAETTLMDYEYRNPVKQVDGAIHCEINHPDFGWVDFAARPDDVEPLGRAFYEKIAAADAEIAVSTAPPPPLDDIKAQAVEQVKVRHAEMLGKLTGDYSAEERDTWSMQLEWARGYLTDQNAEHGALLSGMVPIDLATSFAGDAQMMAEKITGKAANAAKLTMIAYRTKSEAKSAIAAATTLEALEITMAALVDIETAAIAELAKET